MNIKVNKDLCIGCGTCVSMCEAVFELGEEMKARVRKDAKPEENQECIKQAVVSCPVQAIEEK